MKDSVEDSAFAVNTALHASADEGSWGTKGLLDIAVPAIRASRAGDDT